PATGRYATDSTTASCPCRTKLSIWRIVGDSSLRSANWYSCHHQRYGRKVTAAMTIDRTGPRLTARPNSPTASTSTAVPDASTPTSPHAMAPAIRGRDGSSVSATYRHARPPRIPDVKPRLVPHVAFWVPWP